MVPRLFTPGPDAQIVMLREAWEERVRELFATFREHLASADVRYIQTELGVQRAALRGDTAYGRAPGDVGSTYKFIEYKFGDIQRLNPPVWRLTNQCAMMWQGCVWRFIRSHKKPWRCKTP